MLWIRLSIQANTVQRIDLKLHTMGLLKAD